MTYAKWDIPAYVQCLISTSYAMSLWRCHSSGPTTAGSWLQLRLQPLRHELDGHRRNVPRSGTMGKKQLGKNWAGEKAATVQRLYWLKA